MKEWLEFYVTDRILWWWHDLFTHRHEYSMSGMALYKGEPREHPSGIPVVAWIFKCKCDHEIVQVDRAGIRLLQQGVDYDALIEYRI